MFTENNDLSILKINTIRKWICLTKKRMLDRLRIITDSCLPTNPAYRRVSWSIQRFRCKSARRASQSSFPFDRRERERSPLPLSLSLSIPLHVCSIIPTLPIFLSFSPPVRYTPRFGSSWPYTRTHRSDASSVGVSREVRVRAHARTYACMRERIKRPGRGVRMWFAPLLEIHRDSRAVCGRPAAKGKRARGEVPRSVIRDMREIEFETVTTQLDRSVLVRLSCKKIEGSLLVIVVNLFGSIPFPQDRQNAHAGGVVSHWIFSEICKKLRVHNAINLAWIELMVYLTLIDFRFANCKKKHKRIFKQ